MYLINFNEINMYNIKYWEKYYKNKTNIDNHSSFAEFCLSYINKGDNILDICCGDGRDSVYFNNKDLKVTGIDLVKPNTNIFTFKKVDLSDKLSDFSLSTKFNNVYSRFMLHSIPEDIEDYVLINCNNILHESGLLFIEVRSDKGVIPNTTNDHYRRLLNLELLKSKLINLNFDIIYIEESADWSIAKEDNPILIRIVARKKSKFNVVSQDSFTDFHKQAGKLNFKSGEHMLLSVKKVLDSNNIKFLLAFGTLLGAYRNKNFIEYDEDVDIAILKTDKPKIDQLIKNGYFKIYGLEYIRNDANMLYSLKYKNDYIDFYFFLDAGLHYNCSIYNVDKLQFDMPSKIKFLGEEYQTFSYIEKFLIDRYGENWRTPIKNKSAI